MRLGLLGSVFLWLASAGWVAAQAVDGSCGAGGCFSGPTAFGKDQIVDNAFTTEECCPPPPCTWVNLEYLYWFLRDAPLPPLVTTSNPSSPMFDANSGIIGYPNTRVVYGQERVGLRDVQGGRLTAGFWVDPGQNLGAEASYFGLRIARNRFFEDSDLSGRPVLARPVFNPRTNVETAELVTFPQQFAGYVGASHQTALFGAEANAVLSPCSCYFDFADYLIGFRYLDLDEEFHMAQLTDLLPAGVGAFRGTLVREPGLFSIGDKFTAYSQFYGAQVGVRKQYDCGLFYYRLQAKLAAGITRETVHIQGRTHLSNGRGIVSTDGGLLALPTNSGRYTQQEFSLVPEAEITLGFRVTRHINVHLGYTFLYWSHVQRPGDVIDRTINPTQLPTSRQFGALAGPARPTFDFNHSDFWAHGVNIGLGFEY